MSRFTIRASYGVLIMFISTAMAASTTMMVCNADNCLRAVRASAFPAHSGTADCSSYFLTTVIPPTVTIIATSTVPQTTTAISDVISTSITSSTLIETLTVTETDVISVIPTTMTKTTPTVTLDETATYDFGVTATSVLYTTIDDVIDTAAVTTVDVTVVQTNQVTATVVTTNSVTLLDRRSTLDSPTTIPPSSIPKYASACSGTARYSSACSCISFTASTITLPAPSTTITVPFSPTLYTITSTITISTAVAIVTPETDTVYTTQSTETDYTTVSTATLILTNPTTTATTTVSTETDTITLDTTTLVIPAATTTIDSTTTTSTSLFTETTLQTTVTLATQTTTATTSVTPTCANSAPTFALQVVGGSYNGQYLFGTPFSGQGVDLASAKTSISAASAYSLSSNGALVEYNGNILKAVPNAAFTYAEFAPNQAGLQEYSCMISGGQLTCASGSTTQLGICNISGPVLVLRQLSYPYPNGYGCFDVALNVIPLCIVPF